MTRPTTMIVVIALYGLWNMGRFLEYELRRILMCTIPDTFSTLSSFVRERFVFNVYVPAQFMNAKTTEHCDL